MDYQLITTTDEQNFAQTAATLLRDGIVSAIEQRGQCILGLSGGKTPHSIYTALGQMDGIEWGRVWLYLVDERYVPADHADSNQQLIRSTIYRYVELGNTEQFVSPDTTLPIEECVLKFEQDLANLFERGKTDVLALGIGDDGHICSLFPPVPTHALDGSKLALHTTTDRFAVRDRITITIPPMKDARQQCFFFTGEKKMQAWKEMEASDEGPERWPMKAVMALGETTVVML